MCDGYKIGESLPSVGDVFSTCSSYSTGLSGTSSRGALKGILTKVLSASRGVLGAVEALEVRLRRRLIRKLLRLSMVLPLSRFEANVVRMSRTKVRNTGTHCTMIVPVISEEYHIWDIPLRQM